MQLLVRNRVRDYAAWRRYFDADTEAAAAYGVTFVRMWRSADDPNDVFFLLDVDSMARAEAPAPPT